MKKPKSQRRRIHDAATPTVGRMPNSRGVELHVFPCGHPEKTVTFTLGWWQIRNLLRDIRGIAAGEAEALRTHASTIESEVK